MFRMNSIEGRDCMVQAVASWSGDMNALDSLIETRTGQLEEMHGQRFELAREIASLNELLSVTGFVGEVSHTTVKSVTEIAELVSEAGGLFVGLRAGTDTPPHIHHVDTVQDGWLGSAQGWLSSERVMEELMTQGVVDVFIVSDMASG